MLAWNTLLCGKVKTVKLSTNMRVQLQNDRSAEIFSHQLLDSGNGKAPVDLTSGRISLPHNFCNLVMSKEELVKKKYSPILNQLNKNWLSERAIHVAKKNARQSHTCPSILLWKRLIIQQNFWIHSICRYATAIENRHSNYHVAKYQPAKALQRQAACSKKN